MTPRIGSLCSGAGGLDLAVEHVTGGRTIWHAEYDDDAAKVLETRWPGVPNHRDITATDWTEVEPIDILTAGYPCQPFSTAGQRKGTDDERHLWPHVAQAIRVLRPRLVVLENVAGHRSLGFDSVLADLAEMRYVGSWCSIRASDVGAPHRRERLFIVAYPVRWNKGRPESAGFVGRSDVALGGDEVDRLDLLPTPSVADGMGGHLSRSGARSGELLLPGVAKAYAEGALLPTPSAADGNGGGRYNSDGHQSTLPGTVRELLPTPAARDSKGPADPNRDGGPDLYAALALLPTPNASDASGGGAHPDRREGHSRQLIDYALLNGTPQWGKYAPAIRRWESVTREAPSPTELGTKGNPRLAAAFSEWMQGWPLGWVTDIDISRSAMLRIIGNGVVPQQAIAALYWLLSVCEVAA